MSAVKEIAVEIAQTVAQKPAEVVAMSAGSVYATGTLAGFFSVWLQPVVGMLTLALIVSRLYLIWKYDIPARHREELDAEKNSAKEPKS